MGFISNMQAKFLTVEQRLLKFLSTNKVVIGAVIKYMNLAYTKLDGKGKMQEAIKFLLIFCKDSNVSDSKTAEITKQIENGVQVVYDQLKSKGLLQ